MTDYPDKQAARTAEYLDAWESLTPEQLAEMAAAGVTGPQCAYISNERKVSLRAKGMTATEEENSGPDRPCLAEDAATLYDNSPALATRPEPAPADLPGEIAELFGVIIPEPMRAAFTAWYDGRVRVEVQRENSLLLTRLVAYLMAPGNLRLRAHALAHAARLAHIMGLRSLHHSVEMICKGGDEASVEGIRKVAWKWIVLLELQPLDNAKSPEACEIYRHNKLSDKHWRKEKCTLENLSKLPRQTPSKSQPPA